MGTLRESYRNSLPRLTPETGQGLSEDEHHARTRKWAAGTVSVAAISLWIVLSEIDRLIADAASSSGRSASASSLQTIDPRLGQENWGIWNNLAATAEPGAVGLHQQVVTLLTLYFIIDALFAVFYSTLLFQFFRSWRVQMVFIAIVFVSEMAESGLQLITLYACPNVQPGAPILIGSMWITWVKWAALAAVVISVLAVPTLRTAMAMALGRTWRALFIHRIALVVLLLISALALLPIPGVNDQMPDTQRAWLGAGWWPFFITSLVALFVACGLFYVGRRRSRLVWRIYHTDGLDDIESYLQLPGSRPKYWPWVVLPLGVIAAYLIVRATSAREYWSFGWPLGAAVGVPMLVAVVSFFLWLFGPRPMPPHLRRPDHGRAFDAWRCGDILAMAFIAMAGMALIRSFAAPLALEIAGASSPDVHVAWIWFYLMAGLLIMLLAFPSGALLAASRWGTVLEPRRKPTRSTIVAGRVFAALTVISLGGYVVFPAFLSGALGVPATAMLLAGSWGILIALIVVALQGQRPLRLFAAMRLRANPVLTLLVTTMLIGAIGSTPELHAIRPGPEGVAGPSTERETVAQAFGAWMRSDSPCLVTDTGQAQTVRPMILVAAEGGGIRAASWTTRALEKLRATKDGCAADSVILSSGVSGGSVGLTLSHLYGSNAVAKMEKIAAPDALSAAVSGAFAGDMIGANFGLKVPTHFTDEATGGTLLAWNDRAGLLESVWEQSAADMAKPFDYGISGPTGALLLNSTDTGTGCRVVVSQLILPGQATTGPGHSTDCLSAKGMPLSIDLLDEINAASTCQQSLRWSTAALLSARFPIISPAGRTLVATRDGAGNVKCAGEKGFQLIDGGYSEGSALGTISDVWPTLQKSVLEHNACVLAAQEVTAGENAGGTLCKPDEPFVVPVFLFLQNSPGADIIPKAPKAAKELMVPLVGMNAKNLQSGSAAWIQRLNAGANVCPEPSTNNACAEASSKIKKALGGESVVTVAPNSVPALAAPLGWSLSDMSQKQLAQAMDTEAAGASQPFGQLLTLLGRSPR